MNPAQVSQCTGARPSSSLSQVEELVLLVHVGARAVEAVAPAVVLADELPGVAAGLVAGRAVPHELVAAVPADVVEGPDPPVRVARRR